MNIRELVEAKKHDIEEIQRTDDLTKQVKESITKKYREMMEEVDKKLLEIASATKELSINHLEFSLPYRDKYDGGLKIHEDGYMYVGDFLFHRPNDKADDISLFRIAPMLSDTNCVAEIEQAFIEKVDAYFEKKKEKSNANFKEKFDELSRINQKKKYIVSIVTNVEVDADDAESAAQIGCNRLKNVDCFVGDYSVKEAVKNKESERTND